MNKNLGLSGFLAIVALTASGAASAQEATFDFTGTVDSATGVYGSAGPDITGTITINFGAANIAQSEGTIGSTSGSPWTAQVYGGSLYNLPAPTALVFNETINGLGVSYGPSYPASYFVDNFVGCTSACATTNVAGTPIWYATDNEFLTNNIWTTNYIYFTGLSGSALGATAPYGANGLPILANVGSQNDVLTAVVNGSTVGALQYTITSLTAVSAPEINPASAASGLTLLLGGLAVLRGKRKAGDNVSA
jgi:hypothetical protein